MGKPYNSDSNEWLDVWRLNVGIGHDLNLAFLPYMQKNNWGRIIHISTLSTYTFNGAPPYVSAKCALDGYVRSINREYANDNVLFMAVAPGAIYSEGRYFAKLKKDKPDELDNYFKNHLPAGRLGTGDDIAPITAFLCTNNASFMAGSIVRVDGGGY